MAKTQPLDHPNSSIRLRAALEIGSSARAGQAEELTRRSAVDLVERSSVEPDFFVRDMVTWALTRLPGHVTVPLLLAELRTGGSQGRSQALHTLSKIGDPSAWPAVVAVLADPDDEVARSAWRAAAVLVPEGERPRVARTLATQLGRGGADTRLSLSRALVALGDAGGAEAEAALSSPTPGVRAHAGETMRLRGDPDAGLASAVHAARRVASLGAERAQRVDEE